MSENWNVFSENKPKEKGYYICACEDIEETLALMYFPDDDVWMDEMDGEYDVKLWMDMPVNPIYKK